MLGQYKSYLIVMYTFCSWATTRLYAAAGVEKRLERETLSSGVLDIRNRGSHMQIYEKRKPPAVFRLRAMPQLISHTKNTCSINYYRQCLHAYISREGRKRLKIVYSLIIDRLILFNCSDEMAYRSTGFAWRL